MSKLIRFGVSIDKELITKFDKLIRQKNYNNRSEAIRDLVRQNLIEQEWLKGKEVTGGVTLVYNHNKRELVNKLMDIQHDYHDVIISTQHIHLDDDNCLEIVVVKGKVKLIQKLVNKLKSTKGVKHCLLAKATTGKEIV